MIEISYACQTLLHAIHVLNIVFGHCCMMETPNGKYNISYAIIISV